MPSLAVLVCLVLEFVICGFAMLCGGKREKLAGAFYLSSIALNFLLRAINPSPETSWRYLIVDGLCLVGFFALCWKSPRAWPLWATGFQLLAVAAEFNSIFSLIPLNLKLYSLYTVLYIATYGLLVALLIGTFGAMRARKAIAK